MSDVPQERKETIRVLEGPRGGGSTADWRKRCGVGRTMALCGLGEVGVTGTWVGVTPGKGNRAPQGREMAELGRRRFCSAQGGSRSPCALGSAERVCVSACVCARVCARVHVRVRWLLTGAELGKDCFRRHVENGLDKGQKGKNGQLKRLLLYGRAIKEI